MKFIKIVLLFLFTISMIYILNTSSKNKLLELIKQNPFNYNLGIKIITAKQQNSDATICCPGYGADSSIADTINSYNIFSGNIIGFNFPDYNITPKVNHDNSAYGTPKEILPLIYVLKRCVCDLKIDIINLYGFSAGGGAIINAVSALTTTKYDEHLKSLNISTKNKKEILNALQKGSVILDCPLKSIREIIAFRGPNKDLIAMEKHFSENNMQPIDTLTTLSEMNLTIFLNFADPDEILSNRDDQLFIDRLKKSNLGKTIVTISKDKGHCGYHKVLWDSYKNIKKI